MSSPVHKNGWLFHSLGSKGRVSCGGRSRDHLSIEDPLGDLFGSAELREIVDFDRVDCYSDLSASALLELDFVQVRLDRLI